MSAVIPLYFVVEGHSEEALVRRLIAPFLGESGVAGYARRITTKDESRYLGGKEIRKVHRGGHGRTYKHIRADIVALWKQHQARGAYITTFLDLYHLPRDTPGVAPEGAAPDAFALAAAIEAAILADLSAELPGLRLIPYIQVHEFETLVFAELAQLEVLCETEAELTRLTKFRAALEQLDPESINGGEQTHPAQRLMELFQNFSKTTDGVAVIELIGLPKLLSRLRRFAAWIARLRSLPRA